MFIGLPPVILGRPFRPCFTSTRHSPLLCPHVAAVRSPLPLFSVAPQAYGGASNNYEQSLIRCGWAPGAGDRVVCGSADRLAYVWEFDSGKLLYALPGHTGESNGRPAAASAAAAAAAAMGALPAELTGGEQPASGGVHR